MKKYLIVGLGNIGSEYTETRHNIGFKVIETLAKELDGIFETKKFGDVAWCKYKGRTLVLLKPNTYMNLSGKAVSYWLKQEEISIDNLLVVTDDIHLDFGTFRIKAKGSDGGHNGLKDIQSQLNTSSYHRFRFGVGADFGKGRQVDHVLGSWSSEENKALEMRLAEAAEACKSFAFAGANNTMNQFNGAMPTS